MCIPIIQSWFIDLPPTHRVSIPESLRISSHERFMCFAIYQKVLLRLFFFFLFYSVMSKMHGAMSHYRNRWLKFWTKIEAGRRRPTFSIVKLYIIAPLLVFKLLMLQFVNSWLTLIERKLKVHYFLILMLDANFRLIVLSTPTD